MTSEFLALHFIKNPNLYLYDKNIAPDNFYNKVNTILTFKSHFHIINDALIKYNFKIEKENKYFTLLRR